MRKDACISTDGKYRYWLTRQWEDRKPKVLFVGLNPSTADAVNDDPTLRRCIAFAKQWGYGGLYLVNLYAYRATDPKELIRVKGLGVDIAGNLNNRYIQTCHLVCADVVLCWGSFCYWKERAQEVIKMFPSAYCLGKTKSGAPKHPLYLKSNTPLELY